MAAIAAIIAIGGLAAGYPSPYISTDLNEYDPDWLYPPPYAGAAASRVLQSAVTTHWPVSQTPRAITAINQITYSHDYYHRIHVIPRSLDFGNVSTPKMLSVSFWNAYWHEITLTAVTGEETGLTFSDPFVLPATINPLRMMTFDVTVTRDGTVILDTAIVLSFDSDTDSSSAPITATRMEIWSFAPRAEVIEAVEWNTRVLRAKSSEQRICWREVPRRQYTMTHIATHVQSLVARAMARRNLDFWMPDWPNFVRANAVTGGAVAMDDGDVLIWQDWQTWEVTEVVGGVLGTVNESVPNARIIPLLVGRLVDQWGQDRRAGPFAEMSITLDVSEGTDVGTNTLYPIYDGLPVVTDCNRIGGESFAESVQYQFNTIDNGQSDPQNIKITDYADVSFGVRWLETSRARAKLVREWIYSRRGKWRAFWLPSWDRSITVVSSAIGWVQIAEHDIGEDHLMIEVDGVWVYRAIASYAEFGVDWVLTLDIPRPVGTVGRVMYLRKCRFNADRIEFRHVAGQGVTINVPCIEVPE